MQLTSPSSQFVPSSELGLGPKALIVLNAARNVFFAHGYNASTTDMIQREAGVSKSTVYAHFSNKEKLFLAVVERECEIFTAAIHDLKFTPGNIVETLQNLGVAYLKVALSERAIALYRVVIAEAPRSPLLGHMFYQSGPSVVKNVVIKYLQDADNSGEIDLGPLSKEEAADVFVALMRNELHLYMLTHPDVLVTPEMIKEKVIIYVNTFIRACDACRGCDKHV